MVRQLGATLILALVVFAVAVWQCGLLEHGFSTPPPVGAGEDWDWQLTQIEVARMAIESGQFPGWNPFTQGGQPLWANPELSPPTALLAVAIGTVPAMKATVLVHLFVLCIGWAMLARDLKFPAVAAQLPALALLASSFLAEFLMAAHIMFFAVAWLPLAWLALRRARPGLAGLALAASLYAGGHYVVFYGALLLTAVTLARLVPPRRWIPVALLLALNGFALGVERIPGLGPLLLVAFVWTVLPPFLATAQGRPGFLRPLGHLVIALGIAALIAAPRWLPLIPLIPFIERLQHGQLGSVADPWTLSLVWDHLSAASKPHHELPNSFYGPIAPALFGLGLVVALFRRPRIAALALFFWNLGFAGAGPVNLWEPLQALPGLDQLRVPERFTLLWTPLFALCGAALFDEVRRLNRYATVVPAALVGLWLSQAIPAAQGAQRMGGQAHPERIDGPFVQRNCQDSNWAHVLRGEGCLNHTSAISLAPAEGLVEGSGAHRVGVAFELDAPGSVPQNFVVGWPEATADGLVAGPAGRLSYRPPLLGWSAVLALLGLLSIPAWRAYANHRQDPPG